MAMEGKRQKYHCNITLSNPDSGINMIIWRMRKFLAHPKCGECVNHYFPNFCAKYQQNLHFTIKFVLISRCLYDSYSTWSAPYQEWNNERTINLRNGVFYQAIHSL